MFTKYIYLSLLVCLFSCSTTPEQDLSDTNLYLFPERLYLDDTKKDFKFSEKEILKAKRAAKKNKIDVLYAIQLDDEGEVIAIRLVKKTRNVDNETVAKFRHQIKRGGLFRAGGSSSAFFYGLKLQTEVEYL